MAALRTHLLCISCTVWMILTSLPGRHAMNSEVPDGFVYTDLYITAREGDELILKCQFYGTPIAVYWKKGNDPTRSPNLITRVVGEPSSGSCVADQSCSMDDDYSLIINRIKVADQGTYICRVSNYKGILIYNFTEVAVYGGSTLPPKTEPTTTEGTTLEPSREGESTLPPKTAKPEPTTEGTTLEPSSEEPSPASCDCLSSGVYVGIAIAILFVGSIIIINVILFIIWRRHSTEKNGSQQVTSSDGRGGSIEETDNMAHEMIGLQSGDRTYTALKLSSSGTFCSANINPENVTFFTRLGSIGRGDFGAVWKGELRSNQGRAAVAIRQIPNHISKSTNLLPSVKVLCELPDQLNVVKCVGFCQEQSSTIYEFIFGGTLLTHLQTTGVQSQPTYSNLKPNRIRIDESSLLNFAWQIAKGMQFLASKKIIHGTLCAHNVLLGDRKQCKLSDYGLASSVYRNRGKPSRWSSPETMVTGVQSTEGDIWSFGIVLWEIVTLGARPYPDMTYDTVQKEVSNGYKMGRPRHCGQELYTIMSRCWETDGQNRIRFEEILKTLERILEKTHDYLSLSDLDKDLYTSLSDSEKDLYESPLDV